MPRAHRMRSALVLALTLLLVGFPSAEICNGGAISKARLATYDAEAVLSPAAHIIALQIHHPSDEPSAARDTDLATYPVSIRAVPHLTGLDLLPTLDVEDLKTVVASEVGPRN